MRNFILILFLSSFNLIKAQFIPVNNIPFEQFGETITAPLTGGINSVQLSDIDINNDGINDLFVFDRGAWAPIPLLKDAFNNYTYAPDLINIFPRLEDWALLRDYNCDGIQDIFTYYNGSTKAFKGVITGGDLSFELAKNVLEYNDDGGGTTPLYTSRTDIPGIIDMDNDGDIDVLSFSVSNTTIRLYKNISVESGYNCDSLIFELNQFCWGELYEGLSCEGGDLFVVCKGGADNEEANARELHIGSTILPFDKDGDGDKDAVIGDNSCTNFVYYRNGGSPDYAQMVYKDPEFPSNTVSYDSPTFPAAYLIDADNDGDQDLIGNTNDDMLGLNTQNLWLYENLNTADTFDFVFKTDTFLISQMVDAGGFSKPVFFDYNNDDLLDIVIGMGNSYGKDEIIRHGLYLYENIGTSSLPSFRLISTDFGGLNAYPLLHLAPAFVDVDNDGDDDMFCGDMIGNITYLENLGGPTGDANFAGPVFIYAAIEVGSYSAPCFIDIDKDDKPDMIVGEQNGNLNYFHNTGTISVPVFTLESEIWGGVDVRKTGFITGNSMPFMYRNENDSLYLLVGSLSGFVYEYNEIEDALAGEFFEADTNYLNWHVGPYSNINGADFNNDGEMEFLVGNERGGLQIFERDHNIAVDDFEKPESLLIFPNPVAETLNIKITTTENIEGNLEIFNSTGELIFHQKISEPAISINLKNVIPPGVYFISIVGEEKVFSSGFIKL
ncbi:MAG: T9SS type A sorting domain-containing protein [Chitinophagales bacterium]